MRLIHFLLATGGFILFSCTANEKDPAAGEKEPFPEDPLVLGLTSPYQLEPGGGFLELADYVTDVNKVDSLSLPTGLRTEGWEKGSSNVVIGGYLENAIGDLKVWSGGHAYSILLKRAVQQQVPFTFSPKGQEYESVMVKGEFNNWNPNASILAKHDDVWTGVFKINPGSYQYKIVADGQELTDPNNLDSISNGMGGFNSILKVEGPDKSQKPVLTTQSYNQEQVVLHSSLAIKEAIVLWQNYRLGKEFVNQEGNKIVIRIPKSAEKLDRSFLRVVAAGEEVASNDVLVPLHKGHVLATSDQLNRQDFEASILYFMMVDRFHNGNTDNDVPLEDERVAERANYHGGDIAGILQKLKEGYFEELNINTIWLSPISQNPEVAYQEYPEPRRFYSGYHGYWPISSSKIDHRFGTEAEMKALVEEAHNRGISILLDYVSNHVHQEHPLIQAHPEYATQLDLENGRKNIRIWDEQRLTTWFDTFLPSFDFSKQEVIDLQVDSAMYWINKYNLDGFRHDATKHIPEAYWRALTKRMKSDIVGPKNQRVFQIGETFGSRELIRSYINSGQLDAQFDFNLYFDAVEAFSKDEYSLERLAASLQSTFDYYGYHSLMGNITGNHDMPRFISFAGGAIGPGDDPKEIGWQQDVTVEDPVGYERLKNLTAFIMTIPGVPVIYYGDDIGMPGANDPDNRRPMRFDQLSEQESSVRESLKKLTALRRNNLALVYGDLQMLHTDAGSMVYFRNYFDQAALVAINKSGEKQNIELEIPKGVDLQKLQANFGHPIVIHDNKAVVQLPPNSFDVYTR